MSDATTALAAAQAAAASSTTASDAADFAAEKAVEVNADRVAAQAAKTDAQAAAAAAGAQMWVGGEAVTTATVRQAPDGSRIKSNAARTTRATFDATEQGFWTPVLSTAGTLEQVALTATFAALNPKALVKNLPTPFTIAHRGGPSDLSPEQSMTAYKVAAAMGAHALEIDCQILADGTLVAMHDTTVSRTTTSTGNVADHTASSWSKLLMNSSGLTGETGWPSEGPPFVEQILRAYGNKICLAIQPYTPAAMTALDKLIQSMGIDKRTILIQTFDTGTELNVLSTAQPLGYATMKLYGTGAAPDAAAINALAALGTTHVCVNQDSMTSTVVNNCVAAGIRPSVFAPTWRQQRDKLLAIGVQGWFTDKPGWLMEVTPKPTTDTFKAQSYSPGVYVTQGTRGTFVTPNKLQLAAGSVKMMHVMECPTGVDPDNCVITFDATVTADGSSTSNALYMYLMQTDYAASDGRTTMDGIALDNVNGYRFSMLTDSGSSIPLRGARYAGDVQVAVILGDGPGSYSLNSKKSFKLTVTPTQLKWEQVGVAGSLFLNQSAYRNLRHLFFANSNGATVQFENVAWV